jgi:hypothetical protein
MVLDQKLIEAGIKVDHQMVRVGIGGSSRQWNFKNEYLTIKVSLWTFDGRDTRTYKESRKEAGGFNIEKIIETIKQFKQAEQVRDLRINRERTTRIESEVLAKKLKKEFGIQEYSGRVGSTDKAADLVKVTFTGLVSEAGARIILKAIESAK